MSKPAKNRRGTVAVPTGPQRVLVITAKGRRRWGWIAPDGSVVGTKADAQ